MRNLEFVLLHLINCIFIFSIPQIFAYSDVELTAEACVRIFSSKGDIGCRSHYSSKFVSNSQYGILYAIDPIDPENNIKYISSLILDYPLGLLIPAHLLNNGSVTAILLNSNRISGVVIYDELDDTKTNTVSSPDVQSPQGFNTPQEDCTIGENKKWNLQGTGNLYNVYPFPIYLVGHQQAEQLLQ